MTERTAGRTQLSIVLPCRNGAETLPRALEALSRQSWTGSWELVFSDNGSTDGSLTVLESFRDRFPSVRVVDSSDKAGVSHALNAGAAAASGESLAFVNDDDEVGEGWLEAFGGALERHELVAGRLEFDRLNEPWTIEVRGRPQSDGLVDWGFGEYLPFAFGASLGVRRELHEAIGGFDETMHPAAEDMDYSWRLQRAGATFTFVPEAITHYRLRHSLGGIYRQGYSYGQGHVLAYKKHRQHGAAPPRHSTARALRSWAGLGKRLSLARNRAQIGIFVWHAGLRLGLARGSLRNRVLFL